jgi:hypothetical protein
MLHAMWGVIAESMGSPGMKQNPQYATAVRDQGKTWKFAQFSARDIDGAAEQVALVRYEVNSAFLLLTLPFASRVHEHEW